MAWFMGLGQPMLISLPHYKQCCQAATPNLKRHLPRSQFQEATKTLWFWSPIDSFLEDTEMFLHFGLKRCCVDWVSQHHWHPHLALANLESLESEPLAATKWCWRSKKTSGESGINCQLAAKWLGLNKFHYSPQHLLMIFDVLLDPLLYPPDSKPPFHLQSVLSATALSWPEICRVVNPSSWDPAFLVNCDDSPTPNFSSAISGEFSSHSMSLTSAFP